MIIMFIEPENSYKIWQISLEGGFVTNNWISSMCGYNFIALTCHALPLHLFLSMTEKQFSYNLL